MAGFTPSPLASTIRPVYATPPGRGGVGAGGAGGAGGGAVTGPGAGGWLGGGVWGTDDGGLGAVGRGAFGTTISANSPVAGTATVTSHVPPPRSRVSTTCDPRTTPATRASVIAPVTIAAWTVVCPSIATPRTIARSS